MGHVDEGGRQPHQTAQTLRAEALAYLDYAQGLAPGPLRREYEALAEEILDRAARIAGEQPATLGADAVGGAV